MTLTPPPSQKNIFVTKAKKNQKNNSSNYDIRCSFNGSNTGPIINVSGHMKHIKQLYNCGPNFLKNGKTRYFSEPKMKTIDRK